MSNHRNTWKQLRKLGIFAGSDAFMQGGHQIINSNRANAGPARKNSEWAKSDKIVQNLLFNIFPKLAKNENQRKRAGKWLRIIQLYHRSGFSAGDVAAEMKITRTSVKGILRHIRLALKGLPLDGRPKFRKKKVSIVSGAQ